MGIRFEGSKGDKGQKGKPGEKGSPNPIRPSSCGNKTTTLVNNCIMTKFKFCCFDSSFLLAKASTGKMGIK